MVLKYNITNQNKDVSESTKECHHYVVEGKDEEGVKSHCISERRVRDRAIDRDVEICKHRHCTENVGFVLRLCFEGLF